LYGSEILSLTLRIEYRVKVFENRVLGKIFLFTKEEVAGGWRRLHDEELPNLYASPNILTIMRTRGMRWAWYLPHMRHEEFIQNFGQRT
jgi:hypothetical protein